MSGKANRCKTCSAWSELLAEAKAGGPVKAMCLNPASDAHGTYVSGEQGCSAHTTDPALADHPSSRAPDARPHDEGQTAVRAAQKNIARQRPLGMIEQLREIFGDDNVVDLSKGQPVPGPFDPHVDQDRVLEDGRVERSATRKSPLSGEVRTRTFIASADQWAALDKGGLIQQALPHLALGDREFLMTGITDEEWNEAFPEDDEADEALTPRPKHW